MKPLISILVFFLIFFSYNCSSHKEDLHSYKFVGNFNNHILKNYILSNIETDSGFYDLTKDTSLVAEDKFLKIDSEKKNDINGHSIYSLKFTIKQHANRKHQNDPYGVGSESLRLIVYNKCSKSNFKVFFDTKFYQPECGSPDYSLDTIQSININSIKFISIDIKYHYRVCCGSSDIDSIISYVYDKNFRLINHYEKFYLNQRNDDCKESDLPIIKRMSFLTENNGNIDLVRKTYINCEFKDSMIISKILKID
jgi:hypothetical protein